MRAGIMWQAGRFGRCGTSFPGVLSLLLVGVALLVVLSGCGATDAETRTAPAESAGTRPDSTGEEHVAGPRAASPEAESGGVAAVDGPSAAAVAVGTVAAVAARQFRSMAEEARIGVATAGMNEARASLSVAFAKLYLRKERAGEDTAAITGADVMVAAGFGETQTFGEVVVAMRSAGRTVTLTATSLASAAIPEDRRPTAVWTVPKDLR